MTISMTQFGGSPGAMSSTYRPRSALRVPSAQISGDTQTGQSKQHHKLPGNATVPLVLQRGTGKTIDRMMSMGRPAVTHPHDLPLPGGASAAGAPGSVLWASGA